MKFNFSIKNLSSFNRFSAKKVLIGDLIHYSAIFLLLLFFGFLVFYGYVSYLYFYGFNFSQDEKTPVSFSKADYEKAIKIIDEREKIFSDIAAEVKIMSLDPFK